MAKTGSAYRALQRAPGLRTEAIRRSPAPFAYFTGRFFKGPADHSPVHRCRMGGRPRDLSDARGCSSPRVGALHASLQDSDGACRQGQLAFGLRPRAGGAVYPGKPEWWEIEGNTLHYRFEWFRTSSAAPFANGLRDDADWICIARDSLDAPLLRLGSSHVGAATAKGEADATRHLADKLKENPGMTREEASAECARFGISKRGFLNRVFPKAREKAGLPARASAGRKRNNRSAKSKR
jgi:hypothetical protein